MAKGNADLNAAVLRRAKSLSIEAKQIFETTFAKAPLMLQLLGFLNQQQNEKFRTQDAVLFLYQVKQTAPDYIQYENRFFKLRKKFHDYFQAIPASNVHETFTPHEIQLLEIKALIIKGNYDEAAKLLPPLEEKLWADNVFELLPETLDLTMHLHQLQRKVILNEPVYARQKKAIELYNDLLSAKQLAREIFDTNIMNGLKKAAPLFLKLQRLSINRKEYPRFKLIYNVISANCKLSGGGTDFKPDFKIINRFISTMQKINTLHPNMPDYNYMAGYVHTQSFRFKYMSVMNYYAAGQFKEAANVMREIYDLIMAEDSPLKRMRSPFQFNAFCVAFIGAERFAEALEAANHYLKYAREIKNEEDLLKAYIEIAHVHIWLYPQKSGYSDVFIQQKIDQFIRFASKRRFSGYYGGLGKWMKVKLMLAKGEYAKALALYSKNNFSEYFTDPALNNEAKKTLELLLAIEQGKSNKKQIGEQLASLHVRKLKTILPPDYQNFRFLERVLAKAPSVLS